MGDWGRIRSYKTQTRAQAFQTLGRAFDFLLRLQKLGQAFQMLGCVL